MEKKWERPELIILTRGKPEEAVLDGCKGDGSTSKEGDTTGMCLNPLPFADTCMSLAAS